MDISKFKFRSPIILLNIIGTVILISVIAITIKNSNFVNKAVPIPQSSTPSPIPTTIALPIASNTPTQNSNIDYVKGDVLVMFKTGISYKQVKNYINGLGLSVENTNIGWNVSKFQPSDSTILKNAMDTIFLIKVPPGQEDIYIAQVIKSPLVSTAEKNTIVHADSMSHAVH